MKVLPWVVTLLIGCVAYLIFVETSESEGEVVRVAYWRQLGQNRELDLHLERMSRDFSAANPGTRVELVPIQAGESEYHTKLTLQMSSPSTAPDLVYEDSFRIDSDVAAGRLAPLTDKLAGWPQWRQFHQSVIPAVTAADGRVYGVPVGTDTRALWYDREVFAKAGLPVQWEPRTWDDVLAAARAIRDRVPGAVPLHVPTGKANGEATSMQGFQMLLRGTGDVLHDGRWVTGTDGFRDALGFVHTVFREGLGPKLSDALNPAVESLVATEWFPRHQVGIVLTGSWLKYGWRSTWPDWERSVGVAPMPTQHGQAPGVATLSGGWTWAIPANAAKPDLAWRFLTFTQTTANATALTVAQSTLAVRADVAAAAEYQALGPVHATFTDLVRVTVFRPALPEYPRVSALLQDAMEAVTTGARTPTEAAADYDAALLGAVG